MGASVALTYGKKHGAAAMTKDCDRLLIMTGAEDIRRFASLADELPAPLAQALVYLDTRVRVFEDVVRVFLPFIDFEPGKELDLVGVLERNLSEIDPAIDDLVKVVAEHEPTMRGFADFSATDGG